ncbi:MAG: MFS transporter [Beijerinckiaceae bacterium]
MRSDAGAAEEGQPVSLRVQAAVYGVGLFVTSIFHIGSVIIPLYVYTMNPSPLLFGLTFSAAHILPFLFSIHAGALMDRFGARRVMFACTLASAILPLLYPMAPAVWALIVLQMFLGLAESMGWIGAQTMIGQYMHGKTVYAGRLSFVIRIGQLAGPPLAGVTWDLTGAWGSFILMSVWCLGGFFCALLLPPLSAAARGAAPTNAHLKSGKLRALLPRWSDYATAFSLLSAPAVVIIVVLGAMMHVGNAVQSSFYVAWLKDMGIAGTAIGLLSPAGAVGAAVFSLLTAPLTRYVSGFWITLFSLWAGVLFVCVTPLMGSYLALQIAMFLRSGMNGLAQPLVITLVLRGAGRSNQGKAIGLRGTANRVASILAPLAMGAIAEAVGLEASFYVVGGLVSLGMIAIAVYLIRRPDVARSGEE